MSKRRIFQSFDNFTTFEDVPDWMEPEELDALPILEDEELWTNYLLARNAHYAACMAIRYALRYEPKQVNPRLQELADEASMKLVKAVEDIGSIKTKDAIEQFYSVFEQWVKARSQ